MPLTTKAVGWLAGRIGGSRARNRTMNWMNKTALGQALGYGGDLGLMFGVGKGLQTFGKLGKLANTGAGRAASRAGNFLAGTPGVESTDLANVANAQLSGSPGIYGRVARGAQGVANYAMDPKNALVVGQALNTGLQGYQAGQANQIAEEQAAEQRRINQRAAELLMPLFMRLYGPRQSGQ